MDTKGGNHDAEGERHRRSSPDRRSVIVPACLARVRVSLALLTLFLATPWLSAGASWPHWRGPAWNGHSEETNLPVQWDAKAVLWKVPLPGRGQSSPVIAGERIFLTAALENGKQRVVFCLDRRDG